MKIKLNLNKTALQKGLMLLAAVIVVLSVSACQSKNFVDPNGPNLEQTTVQTLVTGVEAGMRNDLEFYLRDVAVIGREAFYLEPSDPRYTGELLGKKGTQMDPSGFLLVRSWSSRYRVIRNCNTLIAKGDVGANGFAKTIMAYQLLLNLNMTYNNGIRVDVAGANPGPFVTKDAALDAISALLDDGKKDLDAAGATFNFKLSDGFADFNTPASFAKFNRGLKARVSIYQKNYAAALTALSQSFLDVSAPLTKGVYLSYGTGAGDQLNPVYEVPTATSIKLFTHPSFVADAEAGDTRVAAKTLKRSEATTIDSLTSDLAQTLVSGPTAPFPIIRNEELILLRAEASIGNNDLVTAQTDINFIRAAAGLGPVVLTPATALDELLKQKRYSLFLEGFRWIDMRLYGKLGQLPIDRPGDLVHESMPRPSTEI